MNPLSISKYVQYCMGFGYVNKKAYAEDLAALRNTQQTQQLQMDASTRALINREFYQGIAQNALLQRLPVPQPLLNVLQFLNQNLFRPIQNLVQNLTTTLLAFLGMQPGLTPQANRGVFEQALNRMVNFLMGFKKERSEEAKRRDDDNIPESDIFDPFAVLATTNDTSDGES